MKLKYVIVVTVIAVAAIATTGAMAANRHTPAPQPTHGGVAGIIDNASWPIQGSSPVLQPQPVDITRVKEMR